MSQPMSVALGVLVAPVATWSPERDAPDESFDYIDLSAVDQNRKVIIEAREVPCAEAPSRAKQIVAAGDVLVSTVRPNLNGVARVPPEMDGATASTGFCVLRPRSERLDSAYLFHWVRSPHFIAEMVRRATGASYPAVSDRIVLESQLPLPSVPDQRQIADVLDKAEALRAKRRAALAQLDTLIQAIFLDLFGDPTPQTQRFPIQPLETLLNQPLQNGAYYPKESYTDVGGVEMVHMSDAFYEVVPRGNLKRVHCSKSDIKKYALTELDILIARRSLTLEGAAKPCLIPKSNEPLIFESSFIRVTPDPKTISALYLYHYLGNERVKQKCVQPYITQSTISGINQSNLGRVPVIVPPLPLQHDFARRVRAVEKLKVAHRNSLAELDALFASLQHGAFRGEL